MTPKQKKINAAKKRIDDRAKKLLDPEVYKRIKEVGSAKYDSLEDFVKAAVEVTRWSRAFEESKKKVA